MTWIHSAKDTSVNVDDEQDMRKFAASLVDDLTEIRIELDSRSNSIECALRYFNEIVSSAKPGSYDNDD